MQHDSIDVYETQRLARVLLREKWRKANIRSALRRYSTGCNMLVRWQDGPTEKQVKEVVEGFAGTAFDDKRLRKIKIYSWLAPDGTVSKAYSPGLEDLEEYEYPPHDPHARLVRFEVDYVHIRRWISKELREQAEEEGKNPREIDAFEPPMPRGKVNKWIGPTIWQDPYQEIGPIHYIDYSEKAFVLRGPGILPFRKFVRKLGGMYQPALRGGPGYVFNKRRAPQVAEFLSKWTDQDVIPVDEPIIDFV